MLKKINSALQDYKHKMNKRYRHTLFLKNFNDRKDLLTDGGRFVCRKEDIYPCLFDATATTGFDHHYLLHTAWATRTLAKNSPEKHVDIGSCLRFASMVSAFIPIDFYDYRPAQLQLTGLNSNHADITQLPFADNSIKSLSSMHVVEHIGLTRYGDPFDPQGDIKAMNELQRVIAPGGNLLFVVPIGHIAHIQYNAHRVYTPQQIVESFPELSLQEFSYIAEFQRGNEGFFIPNAEFSDIQDDNYGCGCFYFKKM